MNEIILKTGGVDYDLSQDQTGDSVQLCFQYGWSITPVFNSSGLATYTVLVSDDNITFFDYKDLAKDVSIDDSLCDTHMNYLFIRVDTISNGDSGIGNFKLVLKNG